jgi:hypothetical protein
VRGIEGLWTKRRDPGGGVLWLWARRSPDGDDAADLRRAQATLWVGALLMAAGCSVDLTEPYSQAPALLSAQLTIEAGAPHHLRFDGQLNPGREANGTRRRVGGEVVSLLGRSLEPVDRTSDGVRRYLEEWTADPAGGVTEGPPFQQGLLTPPRVTGTGDFPANLTFAPCTPSPGLADTLAPSDTLTLRVTCDEEAGRPTQVAWTLEARRADTGGVLLRLVSNAPPPSPIRLPMEWLDDDAAVGLELELTLIQLYGWSTPGQDYRASFTVRWVHRWSVEPFEHEPEEADEGT